MNRSRRNKPALSVIKQTLKMHPVIIVLLALLVIFGSIYPGRFFSPINFKSILRQFVTLTLFALGPSFVVLTGRLDLSYVGVWMLVAIVLGGTPLAGGSGGPQRTILGAITFTVFYRGLYLSALHPTMVTLLVGIVLIVSIIVSARGLKGVTVT